VLPSERIYQNADTPPMPPPPAPPPFIPKVEQYATITPPPIEAPVSSYPLFPVTTAKFLVLSICTLGFYELYWGYNLGGHPKSGQWRSGRNVLAPESG
jgi:hypothetical protein